MSGELEERLFRPLLKDMFEDLGENGEIGSISEFMYERHRSYSHTHKLRSMLLKMGIVEIIKEGRKTRTVPTKEGKRLIKAFMELLKLVREFDSKGE